MLNIKWPHIWLFWGHREDRTEDKCSNDKASVHFNTHHHSDPSFRAHSYTVSHLPSEVLLSSYVVKQIAVMVLTTSCNSSFAWDRQVRVVTTFDYFSVFQPLSWFQIPTSLEYITLLKRPTCTFLNKRG